MRRTWRRNSATASCRPGAVGESSPPDAGCTLPGPGRSRPRRSPARGSLRPRSPGARSVMFLAHLLQHPRGPSRRVRRAVASCTRSRLMRRGPRTTANAVGCARSVSDRPGSGHHEPGPDQRRHQGLPGIGVLVREDDHQPSVVPKTTHGIGRRPVPCRLRSSASRRNAVAPRNGSASSMSSPSFSPASHLGPSASANAASISGESPWSTRRSQTWKKSMRSEYGNGIVVGRVGADQVEFAGNWKSSRGLAYHRGGRRGRRGPLRVFADPSDPLHQPGRIRPWCRSADRIPRKSQTIGQRESREGATNLVVVVRSTSRER